MSEARISALDVLDSLALVVGWGGLEVGKAGRTLW